MDRPPDKPSVDEEGANASERLRNCEEGTASADGSQLAHPRISSPSSPIRRLSDVEEIIHDRHNSEDPRADFQTLPTPTDTEPNDSQTILSRARQTLVKNEMHQMLSQVQSLEERISKTYAFLTDQEQELRIREARAMQREDWLRHRENSVLRRERQARRKEQEMEDRESGISALCTNSPTSASSQAQDDTPRSSLLSATVKKALGETYRQVGFGGETQQNFPGPVGHGKEPPLTSATLREKFLQGSSDLKEYAVKKHDEAEVSTVNEQAETMLSHPGTEASKSSEAGPSTTDPQTPAKTTLLESQYTPADHSKHISSPSASEPKASATPITPLRRSHQSIRKLLSPLVPRTPPPPYRSPSTVRSGDPSPTFPPPTNFWTKARTAGVALADHVLQSRKVGHTGASKKQKRLEKLEREVQEADAKLDQARREERQKAIERVRELQGP